ncbi:hypothetical protein OQ496_09950 [Acetobacter suratthaniensis]|uniref:Uncharacterized protein n=1 Tax=Acetobacter suratthaniensis TaxID=1502841 RepID=A0ABS3LME3_9PROT|nr:hypothetical protein [Acetobacter suratthaniensis]MBO1328547.1 hypothetical protein [Acetobacter suratthaniensis]MCX2566782.1 hypothetical protein [Acetobacter suratthaniensis]
MKKYFIALALSIMPSISSAATVLSTFDLPTITSFTENGQAGEKIPASAVIGKEVIGVVPGAYKLLKIQTDQGVIFVRPAAVKVDVPPSSLPMLTCKQGVAPGMTTSQIRGSNGLTDGC